MSTRARGKLRHCGQSSRYTIRSQGDNKKKTSEVKVMIKIPSETDDTPWCYKWDGQTDRWDGNLWTLLILFWEGKDHNQNDAVKGNEQYYTKARFKRWKYQLSITSLGTSLTSIIGARQSPETSMITASRSVNHIIWDLYIIISQRRRSDLSLMIFTFFVTIK